MAHSEPHHATRRSLADLLRPLPPNERKPATVQDKVSLPARLIVADDHALIRTGTRTMLESEPDLEVVGEADNGQKTVELCERLRPDLVLMDMWMPEMDGLEATRRIKDSCPATAVLVMTAFPSPDNLMEAVRAGAAGYVLKA